MFGKIVEHFLFILSIYSIQFQNCTCRKLPYRKSNTNIIEVPKICEESKYSAVGEWEAV